MAIEIKVPAMGESVTEATVSKWFKKQGESVARDGRMAIVFASAVSQGQAELGAWARAHAEVPLSGAQVLDRMLWFDSDGHRHFAAAGPGARSAT